uniref:Uncharacterized protein n=1 Tax=Phlebotomus papatasi TaxID=29031 RepID=A0A1B0GMN2_PHLPP
MRFYAGFFTLFVIIELTFAGAGSFASTGTAGQAGVSSSGALPSTYTGNTVSSVGGNYGAQYPYSDNTVGTSPYGMTGGAGGFGGVSGTGTGGDYSGSNAGAFSGAGGGSYAGTGAAPFVPPGQYPPLPSQYDYQNLFLNFWKSLSDNYANAATMTFASPGANAFAAASSGPSHNE